MFGREPGPRGGIREVPGPPEIISQPQVPPRVGVADGSKTLSCSHPQESQDEQERYPPRQQMLSLHVFVRASGGGRGGSCVVGFALIRGVHGACMRMKPLSRPVTRQWRCCRSASASGVSSLRTAVVAPVRVMKVCQPGPTLSLFRYAARYSDE